MTPPSQPDRGPVEPRRNCKEASIRGPRYLPYEAQGRDLVHPPGTGKGSLPNLRWSFADSHNRLGTRRLDGGDDSAQAASSGRHGRVSLVQCIVLTLHELVAANLSLDSASLDAMKLTRSD